jgi:hypothetical protein
MGRFCLMWRLFRRIREIKWRIFDWMFIYIDCFGILFWGFFLVII